MTARRLDPSLLPPSSALARRLRRDHAHRVPVTVEHDGEAVPAFEGEPLAMALLAADRLVLSRSPKLHRARGPSCLRGHCEGCLVRVDDEPNVMACRARARGGAKVHSQNAFPTAALDVFALTDWFFPRGIDHHHLLVGMGRAMNESMQFFARKMAGLGTLPDEAAPVRPARALDAEVLVVGAGASGVSAANALCDKGFRVALADLNSAPGGARLDDPTDDLSLPEIDPRVRFLPSTAVVATYADTTLLEDADGMIEARPRARVFATGTHDVIGMFSQNDLPGVFTARAFARALCHGVLLGERIVLVGAGPWATALASVLASVRGVRVEVVRDRTIVAAHGRSRVDEVTLARGDARETLRCDALVVDGTRAASYELAGQAGAKVRWDGARACFTPVSDDDGATDAPGVYVCGSLRAELASVHARAEDGARVARRVGEDLARESAR